MGKDLTPKAQHIIDKMYPDIKTTVMSDAAGHKASLYDMTAPLARKYPNLYFLMGETIMSDLKEQTLEMAERHLTHIINMDDTGAALPCSEETIVKDLQKWYLGTLDPHFYYRTGNDYRIQESLKNWEKAHT